MGLCASEDSVPASTNTMCGTYHTEFVTMGTPAPFVTDAPIPNALAPGSILVKIRAASINPVDKIIAAGHLPEIGGLKVTLPRSVGSDFAGVVVEVSDGAQVTVLADDGSSKTRAAKVGDHVFGDGIQGSGTFAEYASVVSSQAVLKPDSLSWADAASIPLAGLTAYQAFLQIAAMSPEGAKPVGPSSKVLVLGGSGGVGSMAVQIAKALGAHVAATSSDVELLKSLGCDVAINYHETDWGEQLKGEEYDFIFATVNDSEPSPAHQRALGVLKEDGCFICLLPDILPDPKPEDGRHWNFVLTKSTEGKDLAALLQMVNDGKLKAVINKGKTFPFTAEGWKSLIETSNTGRAKGKLVMEMPDQVYEPAPAPAK